MLFGRASQKIHYWRSNLVIIGIRCKTCCTNNRLNGLTQWKLDQILFKNLLLQEQDYWKLRVILNLGKLSLIFN